MPPADLQRLPTPTCGMTTGSAGLHHLGLAARPIARVLDRLPRLWVARYSRLEEVKDVLRARCSPKSEELVIRIGERPASPDRDETRVSDFRKDHDDHSFWHSPRPIRAATFAFFALISGTPEYLGREANKP